MKNKLKILCDIDGVSCDLISELLIRFNKRLGTNFKHDHITHWDFFHPDSDVFTEDELKVVREIFNEEGLANEVAVMAGLKTALEKVVADGHEVIWLTSPWKESKTWCYDRTIWIERELGHISKKIIFTCNKEEIPGDILIDDNPDFIKRWEASSHNCNGRGLLFRQPWNVREGIDNAFVFINDWEDSMLQFMIDEQISVQTFFNSRLSEI